MGAKVTLLVTDCPICGANLALVGRVHRCMANKASPKPPMANNMANTYRYRDEAKRRAYMRAYMAKKRAKK